MKKHILYLLLFLIPSLLQTEGAIKQVNLPNSQNGILSYSMLPVPGFGLYCFYITDGSLLMAKSTDNGTSWLSAVTTIEILQPDNLFPEVTSCLTSQGKFLVVYKNKSYYIITSENQGATWSNKVLFTVPSDITGCSLNEANTGRMYFLYSSLTEISVKHVYSKESTNYGVSWGSQRTLFTGSCFGSMVKLNSSKLMMFVQNHGIYHSTSTDNGITWGALMPTGIYDTNAGKPFAIKDAAGKLWLYYHYSEPTQFASIRQPDLHYISSINDGISWTPSQRFTNFKGLDLNPSIIVNGTLPLVFFSSNREDINFKHHLWLGSPGDIDTTTLSYIPLQLFSAMKPLPREEVKIKAYIDSPAGIESVILVRSINGSSLSPVSMRDDGLDGDSAANDNVYTFVQPGLFGGDTLTGIISIKDLTGRTSSYSLNGIRALGQDGFLIGINRFKLPITSDGIIADVALGENIPGGLYDGHSVLFSGGFFLSGLSSNFMWANAVASASRIQDYQKGKVGSPVNDPRNVIYDVYASDLPFSFSWIKWKDAVLLGADFYDGNNDGIYDPVDLNSNGQWDPTEDKPDILGDMTTWCVYNDGVPVEVRRFNDVHPQGIEIHQTGFAIADSSQALNNFVFFRYRLINRGLIANRLDSVYFGAWGDPDLGDYVDDLVGCDTLLDAGMTYNDSSDNVFGNNPPAYFNSILQGPATYIPGVTFIDNNNNGIYDEGTDTPLDSAYSYRGAALGIKVYKGAKNLGISSFVHYQASDPFLGDPGNRFEARNYMRGFNKVGAYLNPCTWTLGGVFGGVNCAEVNPLFWYSGDPAAKKGWLNKVPTDQRQMLNTGPFQLFKDKPVDIIIGYSVGRWNGPTNSIIRGKEGIKNARYYYRNNFVVGVEDEMPVTVENYSLLQNYPNPFNPSTIIRYTLASESSIKLIVFNILGQKVRELVNTVQPQGNYEFNFNGSGLASGVYFYTISAASLDNPQTFTSTKKMLLVK